VALAADLLLSPALLTLVATRQRAPRPAAQTTLRPAVQMTPRPSAQGVAPIEGEPATELGNETTP
jgi:hypothetical protein